MTFKDKHTALYNEAYAHIRATVKTETVRGLSGVVHPDKSLARRITGISFGPCEGSPCLRLHLGKESMISLSGADMRDHDPRFIIWLADMV